MAAIIRSNPSHQGGRHHDSRHDRGASTIEYAGLLALAAAIVGTLVTAGVPLVSDSVGRALCRIFSAADADCGAEPAQAGEASEAPAPSASSAPGPDTSVSTASIQDPLSPNPLADYCALDAIDDSVIQQMLDDYCEFREDGLDPDEAYEELLREYEALDLNREYNPDRESDDIITGWWMASNPGWWNGHDLWSDDAVAAMLIANDNTDNPAPGTEAWDEQVERWEESGWPADESGGPSILGMMQQDYESDLQLIWAEQNMDSLYDVLLYAGLETGTIYEPG